MAQLYNEEEMQRHIQNMDIGDKFITEPRVITKTDLELYAISTGDTHPMFLSEERARATDLFYSRGSAHTVGIHK